MNNVLKIGFRFALVVSALALVTASVGAQVTLRTALDIDNDDKADFSVFRPSNNAWYISKSTGGFVIQQFGLANSDYPAPGDYDGDGIGDIAVWRDTDGVWYRLNSSDSSFSADAFGITGDEPIARDYDGDGTTDLAVVRRSNGAMIWYILRSSDGGFVATQFGVSTDFTAPGDYDGDLSFDLAIQRPGANPNDQATFYILNSQDGSLSVVPWGFSADLVVPGDYDGDLKTDIAVVREGQTGFENNLIWYIRRSTDGGLMAEVFGNLDTDLNVQNDYDGDGLTDLAIWRDSDSSFYVRRSTDLTLNVVQWGAPSDFPVASYDTH